MAPLFALSRTRRSRQTHRLQTIHEEEVHWNMEIAIKEKAREPGVCGGERKQHKERHMVSWSQQEDDLLREQVEVQGIDNWTLIAANFKDKTGRQCRRRWFTYLNAECKKGGWSPEEDDLLCEAQKIFGNRWTEIAKVVSGRTDNAVKNRYNTLCKKRVKQDAMNKENVGVNSPPRSRPPPSLSSFKKIRCQENAEENRNPLAVLGQDKGDIDDGGKTSERKVERAFLRRDDPKVSVLLQQAEMLSSLAVRVHTDTSQQRLDSAWKELKDYLTRSGEGETERNQSTQIDFLLDDFNDLMHELGNDSTDTTSSPWSSNHLIDQSLDPVNDKGNRSFTVSWSDLPLDSFKVNALESTTFGSPLQTTSLFNPLTEEIPSPNFSSSERRFLLSVFGSPSPLGCHVSPAQKPPPACKRALLDSL